MHQYAINVRLLIRQCVIHRCKRIGDLLRCFAFDHIAACISYGGVDGEAQLSSDGVEVGTEGISVEAGAVCDTLLGEVIG